MKNGFLMCARLSMGCVYGCMAVCLYSFMTDCAEAIYQVQQHQYVEYRRLLYYD